MPWKSSVWESAETFRREHIIGKWDDLPIDMISVVELELCLDVIPFDELDSRFGIQAALTKDFTGVYIDAETYRHLHRWPEWKLNRLRFSFAHEMGHWFMHKDVADAQDFDDVNDFALWVNDHNGRKNQIEREANEFAGRLLVPLDRLKEKYEAFAAVADSQLPGWRRSSDIRDSLAERIRGDFGGASRCDTDSAPPGGAVA